MHIRETIRNIKSLPKTIYFNFRTLPFNQAIKLPIYVDCDIKFGKLYKNVIELPRAISMFQIKVGKYALDDVPKKNKGYISMTEESKIYFGGMAEFAHGIIICALNNSTIKIGANFYCNKNCTIVSNSKISIGDNVLFGWNVSVRDSDGGNHKIFLEGKEKENKAPIVISDHCWLCAESSVLKGVYLSENIVVGYGSIVSKSIEIGNTVVVGNPARIVRKDIDWTR